MAPPQGKEIPNWEQQGLSGKEQMGIVFRPILRHRCLSRSFKLHRFNKLVIVRASYVGYLQDRTFFFCIR